MKFLEKVVLVIFSYIILIEAIILSLLVFGWLDMSVVGNIVKSILVGDTSSKIVLGVNVVCILLAVKCVFFGSETKESTKTRGVLLENESGKLMISKETIENLVNSVVTEFKDAQEVTTRIELDNANNVMVYANLIVSSNAIIKDLSANLQAKVKEKIKAATDLDVKEVNITIKKVAEEEQNKTENA